MSSVNLVFLLGYVGKDPELRQTQSGQSVAKFSLATNERWRTKDGKTSERTEWHQIVAWGRTAEVCSQYVRKGDPVHIEGRIQTNEWTDKQGQKRRTTEIVVSNIQFLGSRGSADRRAPQAAASRDTSSDEQPARRSGWRDRG